MAKWDKQWNLHLRYPFFLWHLNQILLESKPDAVPLSETSVHGGQKIRSLYHVGYRMLADKTVLQVHLRQTLFIKLPWTDIRVWTGVSVSQNKINCWSALNLDTEFPLRPSTPSETDHIEQRRKFVSPLYSLQVSLTKALRS